MSTSVRIVLLSAAAFLPRAAAAQASRVVTAPAAASTTQAGDTASRASAAAYTIRLTNADRARQVLSRLTFGARPGDLDAVERMGVDAWVDRQLHPERIPDAATDSVLAQLPVTRGTDFDLSTSYPAPFDLGLTLNANLVAIANGQPSRDTTMKVTPAMRDSIADFVQRRQALNQRLNQARQAVAREVIPARLVRAELSDRQLLEVMTDFWENHFSVQSAKVPDPFALAEYDRVIRAHALGKFRDLLGVVAASPMMLYYLDNVQNVVDSLHPNPSEYRFEQALQAHPPLGDTALAHAAKRRRQGLNENYARELMELHTLGVDGGYTQHDVEEVARCLTGWGVDGLVSNVQFAFHADQHDAAAKVVLGVAIPAGRGIEDGQQVLDMLARNPSTAHFIATKLVTHFVNDDPPPALVDRAAKTFIATDGDIREVLRTIILSPEFNSRGAYRTKVKTPLELVTSIQRAMGALPDTTARTTLLLTKLGQTPFGHLTPEGWPDQGVAWMNAGSLMNRINLGAQVGASQFPNVLMARWAPIATLTAPTEEQAVGVVLATVLESDASPATVDAMKGVPLPAGPLTEAQRLGYLGSLVGVAIGSSDFQHR